MTENKSNHPHLLDFLKSHMHIRHDDGSVAKIKDHEINDLHKLIDDHKFQHVWNKGNYRIVIEKVV